MAQPADAAANTEGAAMARLRAVEEALTVQGQANVRVETAIAAIEMKLKGQLKSQLERQQSVDLVVGQVRATSEAAEKKAAATGGLAEEMARVKDIVR